MPSSDAAMRKGFEPHVDESGDCARGVVGVQGCEHDVAGERRLYRDLGGFQVSDFADHYLVGVLSEEGAQTPCEIEADLVVYLHLHDAVDFVFDRILGSEDFDVNGI